MERESINQGERQNLTELKQKIKPKQIQPVLISWYKKRWKMLMSAELRSMSLWFICLLDLLWVRCDYVKFHHYRIHVTDFTVGAFLPPLPSVSSPEKAYLNKNKTLKSKKNKRLLTSFFGVWFMKTCVHRPIKILQFVTKR